MTKPQHVSTFAKDFLRTLITPDENGTLAYRTLHNGLGAIVKGFKYDFSSEVDQEEGLNDFLEQLQEYAKVLRLDLEAFSERYGQAAPIPLDSVGVGPLKEVAHD